MDADLSIRPAETDDGQPIFAFLDPDDYLPEVWADWLHDRRHPPLVCERGGAVVGLVKLSAAGAGAGWLHGLRVAPAVRGQGIASALIAECVRRAELAGFDIVRLMTASGNLPMQRTMARCGWPLVVQSTWLHGPTNGAPWLLTPLPPSALDELSASLAPEPALAGVYCAAWQFNALTAERLAHHLAAGEIWALPGSDAWAIIVSDAGVGSARWVGYAQGSAAALAALVAAVPSMPGPPAEVRALLPRASALAQTLIVAGFRVADDGEYCYAIAIPAPAAPRA